MRAVMVLALAGGLSGVAAATATPAAVSFPIASVPPPNGMAAGHVGIGAAPPTSTSASSTNASNANTSNTNASSTPSNATNGTTLGALPGPPPSSLTSPPQGVPPTPAPATPGLPAPSSTTRVLPSSTGLGSQVNSQLRPAGSLSAGQVAEVQAALASGGLYRGPIDGVFSGATRASVVLFQQIQRLPETGELDAETLSRLINGKSTSTPIGSGGGVGAGVGSNSTTATAGNPATADPFTTLPLGVVTTTTNGAVISRTPAGPPFPLSQPINMSPEMAPPGVLVQP
jgi:hypothetical protein